MQKEQLSALMDGEIREQQAVFSLIDNQELRNSWEGYHLIRDTLRGDLDSVIHLDLSARIAAAIEQEAPLSITAARPAIGRPSQSLWQKLRAWGASSGFGSQLAQAGLAAGVSLAVIVSVQHFGHSGSTANSVEAEQIAPFITQPLSGKTSPVSFGVPDNVFDNALDSQQVEAQRNNVSAMLKDFELQRRLGDGNIVPFSANSSVMQNSAKP
jgi:sigma-E factor negative regulatory protein RseA